MFANGLAKFLGQFQRVILSMRQVSKPIKFIFEQTNLVGLLVFINCTKLSMPAPKLRVQRP